MIVILVIVVVVLVVSLGVYYGIVALDFLDGCYYDDRKEFLLDLIPFYRVLLVARESWEDLKGE